MELRFTKVNTDPENPVVEIEVTNRWSVMLWRISPEPEDGGKDIQDIEIWDRYDLKWVDALRSDELLPVTFGQFYQIVEQAILEWNHRKLGL